MKKYEEAIECFDKAIKLEPNYATGYHNKGISLEKLKRDKEAKECFNKANELKPD